MNPTSDMSGWNTPKQRLLILGSGFASFSLLKSVKSDRWSVSVVSPRNHFLFTPLLPSTTVGTVEFRSIIEPIRHARREIRFIEAAAESVDVSGLTVHCRSESGSFDVPFDTLVIGVGADVNTYGIPGVKEHALPLKELADAREIRQRFLRCLDRAAQPDCTREERERLLRFIVVGGGPTGVEFAAELHDFLREDARRSYPETWREVQIVILEAGSQILNSFDAVLSEYTTRLFRRRNIEVRTGSPVSSVGEHSVTLKNGNTIPFGLLVWSAGVSPRPFTTASSFAKDRIGRILTDPSLRIPLYENIYALGDCASVEGAEVPMTAQVAQQQGAYVAGCLNASGSSRVRPFEYRHYGMLAYVGTNRALADLSRVKGRGFLTFLFWRSAYLTRLVSIRNKMLVLFDWFKTFVFGRDISRF